MADTNEATPQAREQGEQRFSAAGLIIVFLVAIVVTPSRQLRQGHHAE